MYEIEIVDGVHYQFWGMICSSWHNGSDAKLQCGYPDRCVFSIPLDPGNTSDIQFLENFAYCLMLTLVVLLFRGVAFIGFLIDVSVRA